jgi:MraZ protein
VVKSGKKWEKNNYIYTARKKTMTSLFGVYECSADAKGRVLLPGAFKKQLTEVMKKGFVIKRSIFSKSLELYPIGTWNEMVKDVNKLNRFVKKNVEFIRMFNYGVKSLELDDNARMLIPKDLMAFAGIKKDVVLAAATDRIELWDKRAYEKFVKENSNDFDKLAEEVMGGTSTGDAHDNK